MSPAPPRFTSLRTPTLRSEECSRDREAQNRYEAVGKRIRRLRRARGLSQRDLSGHGVSSSYISRVETGERMPSMKALRLIAPKLGVSSEYLESGVEAYELESRVSDAELELRLGETAAALQQFHELLRTEELGSEPALLVRVKIALALGAESEGHRAEAIAKLEEILAESPLAVAERPDLYATLGRSYAAVGEPHRAVILFRRCLEEITESEEVDRALFIRFASYLSYALTDIGDLVGAHQALIDALSRAEGLDDPYTKVRLYWSLARLRGVQGPPRLALAYYREAISLLEVTEDRFYLARAHEACGSALLDQGEAEAAREHLATAERIYREQSHGAFLGSARVE